MPRLISLLLISSLVVGCDRDIPEGGKIPLDQMGQRATQDGARVLTGTVQEALPAGQYTYLRLKTSDGEEWAAVDAAPFTNGQQVTVASQMVMRNFESTALNRTFAAVHFGAIAGGESALRLGANPHEAGMQSAPPVNVGKIEKATGPDARTVEEAWTRKAELNGKTVAIRGVVVKVNEGVMGKNWLHVQDGSGDAAKSTNDITVVTADRAVLGETVTVTGTLRTDKDIGAGYFFAVILEDDHCARGPAGTPSRLAGDRDDRSPGPPLVAGA